MKLTIKTKGGGADIKVELSTAAGKMLTVHEDETRSVNLVAGVEYNLRWMAVATGDAAEIDITATISPANTGFPDWKLNAHDRQLEAGEVKGPGVFHFTLK